MPSLLCLALSNAILATLLAVSVAVVTRYCRRPSVRHALWLLVLLKLITPPIVPFSVTWPRSEEDEPPSAVLDSPMPEISEPISPAPEFVLPIGAATVRERLEPSPPLPYGRGSVVQSIFIVIWFGGALAWWSIAAVRLRRFRRLLRQARPASADVQEQGRRLAVLLGLRRCPPIVFVSAPLSPMLWALGFSPRLLVPVELWRKLTMEQQDTLLTHELSHLRRGDHWVRRLELLVLGLYWWHPVVWWARNRLQEAEEECCDALVVAVLPDAASAYAAALVETVAFLSQSRPAALVGASGAGHVPLLKRRLTMILMEPSSRKPSRIGFWVVLGLGALLLPLAPQAAQTEAFAEPQEVEKKAKPIALDFGFPIVKRFEADPHKLSDCTACHQLPAHDRNFHDKPQSWKDAHDEIVRLMNELRNRQAQFRDAADRRPSAAALDRSEAIEKQQDEIELLKAQVRLKEVHRDVTNNKLSAHRKRLTNYKAVNKSTPGTIAQDMIQEVQLAVTTHEGQLRIDEAELQDSQIRLKQAERRLARLRKAEPRSDAAGKLSENVTWDKTLFDRRIVHHGTVKRGVGVVSIFKMTNHGLRPVHISGVSTPAGPVKAHASAHDLPPGGEAEIVTQLDTNFVNPGENMYRIAVQFDKPDHQEVVLEVRVNVQAADSAKPQNPQRLQELEKKLDELRKEMDNLRREMRPDKPRDPSPDQQKIQAFIYDTWPTLETRHLKQYIPYVQAALRSCKDVGDLGSIEQLLRGTQSHAERLRKELAQLHPDLVIEDEKEAKKLKEALEQIVKLGTGIRDYLKAHASDK